MSKYPAVIGRAEPVDLVGLALGVPAKIDTGAFRSSIHATDIKFKGKGSDRVLVCNLLGHPCSAVVRPFETKDFSEVTVRSSNGQTEERYEVKMRIKLGNKLFVTSFTLADRSDNLFPVLIGRHAMKTKYIVDVSKTHVKKSQLLKDFGVTTPRGVEDLED